MSLLALKLLCSGVMLSETFFLHWLLLAGPCFCLFIGFSTRNLYYLIYAKDSYYYHYRFAPLTITHRNSANISVSIATLPASPGRKGRIGTSLSRQLTNNNENVHPQQVNGKVSTPPHCMPVIIAEPALILGLLAAGKRREEAGRNCILEVDQTLSHTPSIRYVYWARGIGTC